MSEVAVGRSYGAGLPRNIVTIGGGTGNSMAVRAFSEDPFNGEGVTAIATTFDDGGGTGELRKVYGELPAVGDMRQCFDAMSRLSEGARRSLARRVASGDFSEHLNLGGQTLGNVFIAGTIQAELENQGSFSSALGIVGEVFQVKGAVVPPSDDIRTLIFDLADGTRIIGEHQAEGTHLPSLEGVEISFLDGRAETCADIADAIRPADISEAAEAAIKEADLVIIAPGDLYTSIAPNLVVRGMKEALQKANVVMMISNLMNREHHTSEFTTHTYASEITRLIGAKVIERTLYSTTRPDRAALIAQARLGSHPVLPDVEALKRDGFGPRGFDLISHEDISLDPNDRLSETRSQIRHDPAKVASAVLNIYTSNDFSPALMRKELSGLPTRHHEDA